MKASPTKDILGALGLGFYALFTVLPDSSSLVVSWPWVFIWQVALFLPWLWLLRQAWVQQRFVGLGYGLDYGVAIAVLGLGGSTLLAQFPQQARWYGWAALCALAALYALNGWCHSSERRLKLLTIQGGLSMAFILVSLGLWLSQTYLPEVARLQALQPLGLNLGYDFSVLELRNWAPIGHQNYVAGYLVLSVPLLGGLCLSTRSPWKWVWGAGVILGLIDLYTASSRGGWLGMLAIAVFGGLVLLTRRQIPLRLRMMTGLGGVAALGILLLANNRLRSLFSASPLDSTGGETAFRLITNTAGWAMGLAHPLFGAGLGSVPLQYQTYRPGWAGREAELVYQLHSTPAQIWSELGGFGVCLGLAITLWLIYWGVRLWRSQVRTADPNLIFTWSLLAAMLGYSIVSLTDYQLDIVCISGTLFVYSAALLSLLRQSIPVHAITTPLGKTTRLKGVSWAVVGLLLAVGIWLAPIHRAWQLSSLGFNALSQKQLAPLRSNLEEAHRLAPWEPYYAYQLGWNLASFNLPNEDRASRQQRLLQSLEWFRKAVAASPFQEAGASSLGWAELLNGQLPQAMPAFLKATQLVPAKHGGFHSLGLSLLGQQKAELAVAAFALEIVRNPLWLTSPIWSTPQYAAIYPQVQAAVVNLYQQLLQNRPNQDPLTAYLRQCLGGVYWWQGQFAAAEAQWQTSELPLAKQVLAIAQQKTPSTDLPILKAWLEPQQRTEWVQKALAQATKSQPDPQLVEAIQAGMAQSKSLDQWIKQRAPLRQYQRERAGFGVLSRHIDGPAPLDFFPVAENMAMTLFFADLLPSPSYSPDLDNALQPFRAKLWAMLQSTAAKP
ncbi:MAG TPA: O-antigen ligase family protein [Stenomitos sp.]